jgi:hypothetical protein
VEHTKIIASAHLLPWSTRVEDPIVLPDGRKLVTLKDAVDYITKLPKKESDLPEWPNGDRGTIAVQPRRARDDGADRGHEGAEP